MNKLIKILLILAVLIFTLQIVIISISGGHFANNMMFYLYSFIVLLISRPVIKEIEKDFSINYLKQNYKNPLLLSLLIIGFGIGYLWFSTKETTIFGIIIWLYFLFSFLYIFESRITNCIVTLLLGYTIIMLMSDKTNIAAQIAIYLFYFLIIMALTRIREYYIKRAEYNE